MTTAAASGPTIADGPPRIAVPTGYEWVKFLTDAPRTRRADDHLDSKQYVDSLLEIILTSRPPMTVGLFGSWGIGKSSILGELHERIAGRPLRHRHNHAGLLSVLFDVWKYEEDTLRRQLLIAIEQRLRQVDPTAAAKAAVSDRMYARSRVVREQPPELRRRGLLVLGGLVMLSVASGIVTAGASADPFAGAVVFAAVLVGLQQIVKEIVAVPGLLAASSTVETRGENIEYPEEFERAFCELAQAAGTLVLLLDNLDRCEPETVIELLRTVKTFLEPSGLGVFFVIACDDVSLAEYLDAAQQKRAPGATLATLPRIGEDPAFAESYGREFLRKFFAVSVRVTPPSSTGLVTYVAGLLAASGVRDWPSEVRERAAQKLVITIRSNPRHVVQFVNRLSAKRVLVDERMRANTLSIKGELNPIALVFACAIEEHAPDFGVAIVQQPAVLTDFRARADGAPGMGVRGTEDFFKRDSLVRLVRTFPDVPAESLLPLLAMRANEDDATFSGASQVREALESGSWSDIAPRLSESEATVSRLIALIVKYVRSYYRDNLREFSASANEVAGQLATQLLLLKQDRAAQNAEDLALAVLADPLRTTEGSAHALALSVPALMGLLQAAPAETRASALMFLVRGLANPQLISVEPFATRISDASHRRTLALQIATLPSIPRELVKDLAQTVAAVVAEEPREVDRLLETPASQALITPELLTLRFASLGSGPIPADTDPDALGFGLLRFAKNTPALRPAAAEIVANLILKTPELTDGAGVVWRGLRSLDLDDGIIDRVTLATRIANVLERLDPISRSVAGVELIAIVAGQPVADRATTTMDWLRWWLGGTPVAAIRDAIVARFGTDPANLPEGPLVAAALTARTSGLTDADFVYVIGLAAAHDQLQLPRLISEAAGMRRGAGLSDADLKQVLMSAASATGAGDALLALLSVVGSDASEYRAVLEGAMKDSKSANDGGLWGRVIDAALGNALPHAAQALGDVLQAGAPHVRAAFLDLAAVVAPDDARRPAVDAALVQIHPGPEEVGRALAMLDPALTDPRRVISGVESAARLWPVLSAEERVRISTRALKAISQLSDADRAKVRVLVGRGLPEAYFYDALMASWQRVYETALEPARIHELLPMLREANARRAEYELIYSDVPELDRADELARVRDIALTTYGDTDAGREARDLLALLA